MKHTVVNEYPSWSFPPVFESEHKPELKDYVKNEKAQRFIKRNAVLLIGLFALIIWTWVTTAIAAHNARTETTERLTAEFESTLEARIQEVHDEYAAKAFTADAASRAAAMDAEANWIARVLYGIRDNSDKDLKTAVWCVLNRVDNKYYPSSVEEVCQQQSQWMGYSADNPVLTSLKTIALGELEIWYSGERPVSDEFVYLYWTPSKVTLRDNFQDGSMTSYWRAD